MTPEERAAHVLMEFHARRVWCYDPTQHAELEGLIAEQVRQAVAAERERCMAIADAEEDRAKANNCEHSPDMWEGGAETAASTIRMAIRDGAAPVAARPT